MDYQDSPIHPADMLKALDQILVADPRNEEFELSGWHARIAKITLKDSIPKDVRQLFENAKNIALYAYFADGLHQAAGMAGYTALEQALKQKFHQEKESISPEHSPKRLEHYMDIALKQGWIKDEGYESSRPTAIARVQYKYIREMIQSGVAEREGSVPIPEPEDDEILAELQAMGVAKKRLHAGRHVRNFLAHGEGGFSPNSFGVLSKIAEEINQLF